MISSVEDSVGGVEIRRYNPPTFFTARGSFARQRALIRKGFPTDLSNWRFVTLTIDRDRFPDPFVAWCVGKQRLRNFIARLKRKYKFTRWCWKLEFHSEDSEGRIYPHWHLLIDYGVKIDKDDILREWGKGRTQVKRVGNERFDYIFKYAAKAVENIPHWILSRTTVRLFQTSVGFFVTSANDALQAEDASHRVGSGIPEAATQNYDREFPSIGERIEFWERCVVSRSINSDGSVRHRVFEIEQDSWGLLLVRVGRLAIQHRIPRYELYITENLIKTTCLSHLAPCLPAFI